MSTAKSHRHRRSEPGAAFAANRVTRRRTVALLVVVSVAFTGVVARLTQVQAVSAATYAEKGSNQRVRRVALAAERGAIFDRRGVDLALSVSQLTVWANPRVVPDAEVAEYAAKLAPVLGVDEKFLVGRLSKDKAAFVYLARKVDEATAEAVRKLDLPGVDFLPESKRFYPSGPLAGPVLGSVGLDNQGLSGLEVAYEKILAGRPGEIVMEQDPQGREIPQGRGSFRPSVRGHDLVLTIDQSLQYEVEQALVAQVASATAKGGTAVVMDTRSGHILAMANVTGDGGGASRPAASTEKNRAVTDVYEPGSTNKVITMAGAIEDGLVTPESRFNVPDRYPVGNHVFSDHDPHPPTDWSVTDILTQSSNVGTIMVAQKLGKERLDHYLRSFGFGTRTGIRFPGEPNGLLLDPDDYWITSMGTVPIGNGLAVSALQMLQVYAAIANGGVWRSPVLVSATLDESGARHDIPTREPRRVVSPRTAALLNQMLRNVVREGTGTNAAIPGYTVAGKTGTARKPREGARGYSGNYVASFVGFVPAEDPRLAAVVILDEPTPIYGSQVAAPVFSRIMQYALRLERIPPPPPAPSPLSELPPGAGPPAVLVTPGATTGGRAGDTLSRTGEGRPNQAPAPSR